MPSNILKVKSAEEILSPTPKLFTLGDMRFRILPMPDGVLMTLADALSDVTSLLVTLDAFKQNNAPGGTGGSESSTVDIQGLSFKDILPVLPKLIKILLPNATKIIAGCLSDNLKTLAEKSNADLLKMPASEWLNADRVAEEFVASNFSVAKKLEALRLILEAEDIPLIVKNFEALTGIFSSGSTENATIPNSQEPGFTVKSPELTDTASIT